MQQLRIILSFLLVSILGYSQCTGGLFAIPFALAAEPSEELLMSRMPVEDFTCLAENMSREDADKTEETASGCEDDGACLEQLHRIAIDDVSIDLQESLEELSIAALNLLTPLETKEEQFSVRDGPLYAMAPLYARNLVKRE